MCHPVLRCEIANYVARLATFPWFHHLKKASFVAMPHPYACVCALELCTGPGKKRFPGCENFVLAVAYHFCLALPEKFSQPGNHSFAGPCRGCSRLPKLVQTIALSDHCALCSISGVQSSLSTGGYTNIKLLNKFQRTVNGDNGASGSLRARVESARIREAGTRFNWKKRLKNRLKNHLNKIT